MSVNKAILIGNAGNDPELRYTGGGNPVANISLATKETWKNKTSGMREEKTEWHNLVFFGALADLAAKHLKKGSLFYVEGRISTKKWEDKEGKTRYTTEIIVDTLRFLSSGKEGNREPNGNRSLPPDNFDDDDLNF